LFCPFWGERRVRIEAVEVLNRIESHTRCRANGGVDVLHHALTEGRFDLSSGGVVSLRRIDQTLIQTRQDTSLEWARITGCKNYGGRWSWPIKRGLRISQQI